MFYALEVRVRSSRFFEHIEQATELPAHVTALRDSLARIRFTKLWESDESYERLLAATRRSGAMSGPHTLFERSHYVDNYRALRAWERLLLAPFDPEGGHVFVAGYGPPPTASSNLDYLKDLFCEIRDNALAAKQFIASRLTIEPLEIDWDQQGGNPRP